MPLGERHAGQRPHLRLDATHLESRQGGRIASVAVMVAVAVDTDGRREVLGVATGASEAEMSWTGFRRSLADRGLRGVRLVIADDHKGLRAAARRVFSAGLRRCRVHRARNLLGHAAPRQRAAVAAMIRTIVAQDTKAEAFAQWDKVADALRERHRDHLWPLALEETGRPNPAGMALAGMAQDRRGADDHISAPSVMVEQVNHDI